MRSSTRNPHTCPTTEAKAAPVTPMSKTKMQSGSRTTLSSAPVTMPSMALEALPWKRIWLLSVRLLVMNGTPRSDTLR